MRAPSAAMCAFAIATSSTLALAAPPQPAPGVLTKRKTQEAALELVTKLDADGAMQRQTSAMVEQQVSALSEIPCAETALPEVRNLMSEALSPATMRGEIANVYAANFTLDELNWMLDFYETPLGKKWLSVQPRITETMTNISTNRMKEAEPKISAALATATKDARCQMRAQQGR